MLWVLGWMYLGSAAADVDGVHDDANWPSAAVAMSREGRLFVAATMMRLGQEVAGRRICLAIYYPRHYQQLRFPQAHPMLFCFPVHCWWMPCSGYEDEQAPAAAFDSLHTVAVTDRSGLCQCLGAQQLFQIRIDGDTTRTTLTKKELWTLRVLVFDGSSLWSRHGAYFF